jgi:hypothetical protein
MAHLHGLYRIVRLLDGVDFYPLCRVRQEELIDDLYLVIGGLDGSESLRRRHLMRSMMTTSTKPGLSNVTRFTVPRDTVLKRVARLYCSASACHFAVLQLSTAIPTPSAGHATPPSLERTPQGPLDLPNV